MNKRLMGGALAFAATLVLAVGAFAWQDGPGGPPPFGGPGHHGPGGPGGVLGPLEHELNLTDAQKAQIKQLADAFETSTKSLREQAFKAGGGPLEGLTDNFDESAVRAAAQARASVRVEMEVAHARLLSQVYALLTAEQKAKLADLRQRFEQRHAQAEGRPNGGL